MIINDLNFSPGTLKYVVASASRGDSYFFVERKRSSITDPSELSKERTPFYLWLA